MKRDIDEFSDKVLLRVAKSCYFSRSSRDPELEAIFKKQTFLNYDRNLLLFLIESTRHMKPKSIRDMKREIFEIIGNQSSSSYGTVSRSEIQAIYNYIVNPSVQK